MQHSLRYKNSTLSYQKSGHGEKILLLFHGFGQHHHAFASLTENLQSQYTLYAFDLFFHGNSQWNEGEQTLEKEMWKEMMVQFINEHAIKKFSVLGFSMGGKFALACLELFPTQVAHIYLLAPDGIKTNFWYTLATYPFLMRKFFKSMILKPGRLHAITSILHRLRLMDHRLLRFAESQMDKPEKRNRVYYSWVVFRHLKFDMKKMAGEMERHAIKLTLIIGKHDKIITKQNMQPLLRHLHNYELDMLDTGHHGVIAGSIPLLAKPESQ